MNRKVLFSAFIAAISLILTGCKTAPIHDIIDSPIPLDQNLSAQEIRSAIIRAGSMLGWRMTPIEDGEIGAVYLVGSHMASVSIRYNEKSHSILYKSSANLRHDEDDHSIHKIYNRWIHQLDEAISFHLTH